MKKFDAIRLIKYILVVMLILNLVLPLITFAVNQEAWFFGYELGGIKASCWLLTNGFAGLIIAYYLLKNIKYGFLAVSIFFLVNFVNVMITPLQGLAYPPFFSAGLILSLLGLVMGLDEIYSTKP